MRLVLLAIAAWSVFQITGPQLARAIETDAPETLDACKGIQLWNYESTEPQCIFGLCTPTATAKTVADAVSMNFKHFAQHNEWRTQKIGDKPWIWSDYQAKYRPDDRIDYYQRFISFQFELGPLCRQVKKAGFSVIKFSCDVYDKTSAGCFIAVYKEGDPSVKDASIKAVKQHQWGPTVKNTDPSIGLDWSDEELDDPDYRTTIYTTLINEAVNRTVISRTPPNVSNTKFSALDPSPAHCPVVLGTPLDPNNLPHGDLPSTPSQDLTPPESLRI